MIELPALSIRQPWAWSIVHAGKDIENRSWPTRFRGRVLIHASMGMTHDDYEDGLLTARAVAEVRPELKGGHFPGFDSLPRGGIVGVAEIVDCVEQSDSPWFFGRFGFVLVNARPLPFHPCKGRLGFFKVQYPYEVAA